MMILWKLIGPFGVIVAIAIWWVRFNHKIRKFYNSFPSPPGIPILGNALDFSSAESLLPVFQNYTNTLGGMVRINFGPFKKIILVSDYKFLEFILSSTKIINKSKSYDFLMPWLGSGLLTSEGTKWRKHRRIITPAFHFQILEQFIDVFENGGNIFVKKLEKEVGKVNVNIYPLVTLCTLDIICDSAMGTIVNAQGDSESDYVTSVKEMCRIIVERSVSPLGANDFLYSFTKNCKIQKRALTILHNYTNSVINKKREQLIMNATKTRRHDDDFGIKRKRAFLDLLLESTVDGRQLTHDEIREEVDTFMFEGHDTTASAISFTLYCLANNGHIQQKALNEQIEIFGNVQNPQTTYQDLQNMKYLENVIKETLRLYPSVPVYSRQTNQEVDFDGITVPKGVHLTIFAFAIQRDAKFFPNPEKFDPDRFDDKNRLPYAFIPFSAGPRNCIGQKFAMLEMKSVISKVLRNYELTAAIPCHKIQLTAETVLKSSNGVNIGIQKRIY